MKTIAAIQADLKTSPVGTRSRLTDELAGKTILRRTVERISRAKRIEEVYVLCPSPQLEHCKSLLEGTGAVVRRFDADPPHWGLLTQTARKWSLEGWRGGIGGTTSFDEYTDCRLLSGLLKTVDAQAVLSVPAAAPLIDPEVADAMIQHREDAEDDLRVTFTQAPPGLTGILLEAPLVNELAEKGTPLGWVFAYQPGNPRKDLIFQPCCYELPSDLRYAVGRLIADTDRSAQAIADLLRDHDEPDSLAIGRWLAEKNRTFVEPLPREVEIELTTDDPYPQSLLRPRGSRVPGRGPIDLAIVEKIVSELARFDDALLVLGGFGDPLRHPQFAPVLDVIRSTPPNEKMIYGLAVRTSGVDLSDDTIEALIANEVDILNVTLDAWTPELYRKLQTPNVGRAVSAEPPASLETVFARVNRLGELRDQQRKAKPIVLPEMTKVKENVHELDDFFDGWILRGGAATISGYSHFAGQCDDRSVIRMAPPSRYGCRRLQSRCLVLADGRVALCDQDFRGLHCVGSLHEQSLEGIWQGNELTRVRDAHITGSFDPTPLCAACDDWHRP